MHDADDDQDEPLGTAAEEAAKLFAVLGERLADAQGAAGAAPDAASGLSALGSMIGPLVRGAMDALADSTEAGERISPFDLAQGWQGAGAGQQWADLAQNAARAAGFAAEPERSGDDPEEPSVGGATPGSESADEDEVVPPGQAAACSYCPICQAIAAVRTVPPQTWERFGAAVLDLAEALQQGASTGREYPRPHVRHVDLDD